MNKKFSTLVASLLLATSLGTVSAATDVKGTISAYPGQTVQAIENGKFYQLSNGGQVLVMEKTQAGTYILKYVDYSEAELINSLWEIKSVKLNNENGIAFQFSNLAYGLPISYDVNKANEWKSKARTVTELSQQSIYWSWMRGTTGASVSRSTALEAYFGAKNDSILTLENTPNGVAAVRYATKDITAAPNAIQVRAVEASPVYLNAFDLNRMLQNGKEKLRLTFTPDVTTGHNEKENLFVTRDYTAVDPVAENTINKGNVADAKKASETAYGIWQDLLSKWGIASDALIASDNQYAPTYKSMRELSSAIALEKQNKRELEEQLTTLKEAYNALKVTEGELNQQLLDASSLSEADEAAYAEATHERVELEQQIKENETALKVADANLTVLRNTAMVMLQQKQEAEAKYESAKELSDALEAAVNEVLGTGKKASEIITKYKNGELTKLTALEGLDQAAADRLIKVLVDLKEAAVKDQTTKDAINAVLTPYAAATTEAETAKNEATQSFDEAGAAIVNQVDVVIKGLTDTKVSLADDAKASDKKLENLRNQAAQSSSAAKNVYKKLEVCKAEQGSKQAEIDPVEEQIAGLTASIATNMDKFNVLSEKVADLQTEYIELYNVEAAARTAAMEAGIAYEDALNYYNGIRYQANNWYSLKAADHSYLMVDTSYLEVEGVDKHLGFKLADHNKNSYDATLNPAGDRYSTVNPRAARDINGRFNFRFYYYPTQDSLVISADAAGRKYESTKNWAERTDAEVWRTENGNIVKLEILGNGRREVTVGYPDYPLEAEWENPTINTRISLGLTSNFSDKVLAAGLYHVTVKNAKNADENGAYLVYDLDGTLTKVKPDAKVDFTHMPATQWAVETATEFGASPAVFNREFYSNTELTGVPYKTLSENEIVATYSYNGKFVQDTLVFNSIADTSLGYYNDKVKINQIYKINNLRVAEGFQINLGSSIMGNDTILSIVADNAGANFELIPVKYDLSYGLNNFTGVKNLKRGKYSLRVKDTNKLVNNGKYVAVSKVNGTEMLVVTEKAERAAQFFLKEIRCVEGVHYYAMLVVNEKNQPIFKAGVDEAMGLIKAEDIKAETTTSAFTLAITDTDLYRRFNDAELGENANDAPNVLKFYSVNSTAKSYLYEDANSKYSTGKGTNFLGIEGKGDNAKAAMYVDTAYVNRKTLMPQYLLAVGTSIVEGSEELCEVCGKPDCEHSKATRGYTEGRYLVNLTDSVAKYAKTANKDKYTWNEDYTRLAFVQARHMGDSLIIMNTNDTIDLANNAHKAGVFSFRLLKEGSNDFLIESESWGSTHFNGGIAPSVGGWVKIQNGVPVIANLTFEEAALQAEIFNVETTDETPTNNDAIGTVTVSVIATDGAVIIKGAQGKKVAISNVLGQTIANTVLTSDEATIAVPAGVVVVAVEGEAAVKAIVK